ncbi:MAG TPA: tRNA (adenosine(37)-N6)-threonylcarbamoyltransferase complex dimerization subunit type 1 TsaB [Chryseolinea sp.]|nr:tRNA (adenosine(37)-N6)-threonylcarbamoyltransferase complex dimerization subunit type 1 TsaB [Chryseolinea sp.]
MALILSLETSTTVCSVAIHRGQDLIAIAEVHVEQSHASKLAVLIDEVKKLTSIELIELNAIAISSGPGSYTGLRIGISTAKGLCYALGIPLISINSLEILAYQMNQVNISKAFLCPMIDARRMEVYCLLSDDKLNILQPTEAKVINALSFSEQLECHPIIFFGSGSAKCEDVITHHNALFIKDIYLSAKHVGAMAYQKLLNKEIEDVGNAEPFYLKEFLIKKPLENKIA